MLRVATLSIVLTSAAAFAPFAGRLAGSGLASGCRSGAMTCRNAAPTAEDMMDAAYTKVAAGLTEAKEAMGLSDGFVTILEGFLAEYLASSKEAGQEPERFGWVLSTMANMVMQQMKDPYKFSTFHQALREEPDDLYKWGNEFFRPLMIMEESRLEGSEFLDEINEKIAAGENVMFLSNHQTEADPQVISLLFEGNEAHEAIAEKVICIAGHRVTTDPLAIPFSMGRNLLCIHSKKHINNPPEEKETKQRQNMETMSKMQELLSEGGQVLWVAPSGGRDRPNDADEFVVAPFDPKSVAMFQILALKSGKKINFYPMAMWTHQLVPPPKEVKQDLGEARSAKRGGARVAVGAAIDPEEHTGSREAFPNAVQEAVTAMYEKLGN